MVGCKGAGVPEQLLSLRVGRKLSEVSRVNDDIALLWQAHRLPDDGKLDVLLSIEEVLTNIIRHGSEGTGNAIVVRANRDADEIEIELEDDGPAFDPLSYPPPRLDLPLQERQRGGLGIHLVQCLMDRVKYERREGRNRFTMAKKLSA